MLDEWKNSFNEKLPSKETYRINLLSLGWSHTWPLYSETKLKDRCKLVLALLEELKSGVRVSEAFTIEHILPDSQAQENSIIGNLLMLEERLNAKCENKSLEEKLPIYAESRYATTRAFAKRYANGCFDVKKRVDFIAKDLFEMVIQ